MAKKATEKSPKKELTTILYDEVIQLPEGKSLRLVFDLAKTLVLSQKYVDELLQIRHIPHNTDAMSPRDPVLQFVVQEYQAQIKAKLIGEAELMYRVQQYYKNATAEVSRDANMIALFSHADNLALLSEEATPYDIDDAVPDPMVMAMPIIEKNIVWPLERRLKRLMDVLISTGAIFKVEALLEHISVRMNLFAQELVEVDDGGFLPEPIDGTIPAEAIPAS